MLYRILLFVHVAGVILWVGGGMLFQILTEMAIKRRDVSQLGAISSSGERLGKTYFAPLSLIVLAAGIGLVLDGGWGFEEPFVVVGIVGLVASALIGAVLIGPTVIALRGAVAGATLDGAAAERAATRLRDIGRIDTIIMAIVVFFMTVKPGT